MAAFEIERNGFYVSLYSNYSMFDDSNNSICAKSKFISLIKNKSINELHFNYKLNDNDAIGLYDILRCNRTIRTIYMDCSNLTDPGIEALCLLIYENDHIKAVHIKLGRIPKKSLILHALCDNDNLKFLEISDTEFINNDIVIINNMLKKNKLITQFTLNNIVFSTEHSINCFEYNTIIKSFDISRCKMTYQQWYNTIISLGNNTSIEYLTMNYNNISDNIDDNYIFSILIGNNKTIKHLIILNSFINEVDFYMYCNELIDNTTLETVKLSYDDNIVNSELIINIIMNNKSLKTFILSNNVDDISLLQKITSYTTIEKITINDVVVK